ncbi:Cardiolipin synthase N-terminal domain-containing protein [Flavobacterium antarcticum]
MFSQGQLIFAAIFATVFIAIIIYSYFKDRKIHTKFYKNSYLILLCFLLFIGLLFVIKTYLKK